MLTNEERLEIEQSIKETNGEIWLRVFPFSSDVVVTVAWAKAAAEALNVRHRRIQKEREERDHVVKESGRETSPEGDS